MIRQQLYHHQQSSYQQNSWKIFPRRDATTHLKVSIATRISSVIISGHGFGTITDIEVGSDGFLYVLTFDGTIYRTVPVTG